MKMYSKRHKIQEYRPVKGLVFLFFTLFLLSNCQIKRSLREAILNQSGKGHSTERIEKRLPGSTTLTENELCSAKNSLFADTDRQNVSEPVNLPVAPLFLLSYLAFLLIFDGFSGDTHLPLAVLFKVLPATSGSPIYIQNRYLLI